MSDNDLSIQDDSVSRCHAELIQSPEGGYTINDLNSSNGTYLNGVRISSPKRLRVGDLLKIGNLQVAVEPHLEGNPVEKAVLSGVENPENLISLDEEFSFEKEEYVSRYSVAPRKAPQKAENSAGNLDPKIGMIEPVLISDELEGVEDTEWANTELREQLAETIREEFRSEIEGLTSDLNEAREEISRLLEINARQLTEQTRTEEQTDQAAKLSREFVQSQEENAVLRSKIIDLEDKLAISERSHAEGAAELQREAQRNYRKNEALQEEIIELEGRLAESERNQRTGTEELEQEIVQSREDNAFLRSEIDALKAELAESESKLQKQSQDQAQTENDIISHLRNQLAETELVTESFEKEKKTLTQANSELKKQLEAAEVTAKKSAEREDRLLQNNDDLADKVEDARGNAAKLEAQLERATSSISENEELMETLKRRLKESEAKSKASRKLEAEFDATERKRLSAEAKVSQLQEKLTSIETETRAVKAQLETSEKDCSKLEEELAQAIKACDELESAEDNLKTKLEQRETSITDLVKSSEELEFNFKETEKEKEKALTDLRLTKEGLSEALALTRKRLADANRDLNIEIYLREAAEKQLREAAAALGTKRSEPEALALSSGDTDLNRISHLTEEKSEELIAFEARLEALYPSEGDKPSDKASAGNGSFPQEEFYRQLLEKLDLVDSFAKLYENKWRYKKVVQQFAQLKDAFLELLEDYSVSQFRLEPGTSLGMKQKNRFDLAPKADGTLPTIDPFGNTQVAETLSPGFTYHDGSREVILRKAEVAVK